jgi:hypothetical protein
MEKKTLMMIPVESFSPRLQELGLSETDFSGKPGQSFTHQRLKRIEPERHMRQVLK